MSRLSRQIEAVRIAESKLEDRRSDLERSGRRLARRAKRLLMPHGVVVGGLLAGVLADRWLFPPNRAASEAASKVNGQTDEHTHPRTSFLAEIGSLLAIANSLTPLAMNAMQLHQRWQASRQPDAAPSDAHRSKPQDEPSTDTDADADAPHGASA